MGDATATGDTDVDLCAAFIDTLDVGGASITVLGTFGHQSTIAVTDPLAARLDELQFALGEGPRFDALRTSRMAVAVDIRASEETRWPIFLAAIAGLNVRALIAVPLMIGAITIGVVDLYRTSPGALSAREQESAALIARIVAVPALNAAFTAADDEAALGRETAPEMRREVHQATGIVLAQLDISATDAFLQLRAFAFSSASTVAGIARQVIAGTIDFRHLPDSTG